MKYFFILAIIFISCNNNTENKTVNTAAQSAKGKDLFTANCAVCHKLDADLIGPSLQNVSARWPDNTLLRNFIKNSAEVIPRNPYAKQLFEKFREAPMPAFPQLSDDDIDAVLSYCNSKQ